MAPRLAITAGAGLLALAAASPAAAAVSVAPAAAGGHGTVLVRATGVPTSVVAVTFRAAGRVLGTDTTSPYAIDVEPARIGGPVVAETVDRRGVRRTSAPRTLQLAVAHAPARELRVRTQAEFRRALPALRRGNVIVRLAAGTYRANRIRLGTGATLRGVGPATRLVAPAGAYENFVVVRGRHVRLSDLRIDGRGRGGGDGRAIEVWTGSSDVRISRVQVVRVRRAGAWLWGAHRDIVIEDSSFSSDGSATGGVLDWGSNSSSDVAVVRTTVRRFRGWGIGFFQVKHGLSRVARRNVALDNVVSDIQDPDRANGTNEGGIWSGGVEGRVIGNRITRTGWTGIETVGSSTRTVIARNRISRTRVGIYLEHSTNDSLVEGNRIADVRANGINVEWTYDGVGSDRNTFRGNRIIRAARTGIFIDVGADANTVEGNVFDRVGGAGVILQGSSRNRVVRNRRCQSGTVIRQQVGLWDDGSRAHPRENALTGNAVGC